MKQKSKKGFAKKSMGQNFLQNAQIREKAIALAGDPFPETALEIGPGLGFMTCKLVKKAKHFTAVELDERVIETLKQDYGHHEHFKLFNENFLNFDLDTYYEQKNYSIIANIPYNITNPIIRKCLDFTKNQPEQMIFMVQKEVGEKICPVKEGKPVKKFKRTVLSISVEVFATAQYAFTVPREDFSPIPNVDSCFIHIKKRPEPLVPKELQKDFFTVVNGAFSERRKKLKNTLPKFFGLTEEQIFPNIDSNQRPEDISIENFIQLTKSIQPYL